MSTFHTADPGFDWRAGELRWPVTSDVRPGLSGVVASGTRVSWLDPGSGTLAYRGHPVQLLAEAHPFEEVAYLLVSGELARDGAPAFGRFRADLRGSAVLPDAVLALLREQDPTTHPTRLLRAGISAVGCHEEGSGEELSGERHWRELRILGQVAALVAHIARIRRGGPELRPVAGASLAELVLAGLLAGAPRPEQVELLDLLWVLYADHGMDAPTFTSMIVASCRADPYYNVVAGLSALRGERQGGATERVLELLLSLDDADHARRRVRELLRANERLPGFGHRVYRRPDPRAALLRRRASELCARLGCEPLFEIAHAIEQEAGPPLSRRGVFININFYAAVLFHVLGADGPLIPCLYAVARTAGMVARVREALEHGSRIYRPRSEYAGP